MNLGIETSAPISNVGFTSTSTENTVATTKYDVFVSHVLEDKEDFVDEFVSSLESKDSEFGMTR